MALLDLLVTPIHRAGRQKALRLGLAAACLASLVLTTLGEADRGPAWTLRHTYRFDPEGLSLEPSDSGMSAHVAGLSKTWEKGHPELPYEIVTFVVPQGARLEGLRVLGATERVVRSGVRLEPAKPIQNDAGRIVEPRPTRLGGPLQKGAVWSARRAGAGFYPPVQVEALGGGRLHGYLLLSFRVYPVRYETDGGRIWVAETLDLEIELELGNPRSPAERRYSPAIEARARRTLRGLVRNPEALNTSGRHPGVRVQKAQGGFKPTAAPSLEGSPVDYVIVTAGSLATAYQTLADWKTRRGVPTVVRTIEWIQDNYKHGSDLQETIRTFIRDAYAKWAVQYVLLGGDTDIIPARYAYSAFGGPTESDIPTDMYFACLDGNWNQDGDDIWGEAAISGSDPGDSTDLYAEVFVGRATASTTAEVNAFTSKVLSYENPTQLDYQGKLLMLGEVLHPVDWSPGQQVNVDGADFSEDVLEHSSACTDTTRLYENNVPFPGSSTLTLQATLDEMNSGYGFVNHIGHGFRYNMSCGDQSLTNTDAFALANSENRFVLYMLNCTATAFDFPCLAEAFLESPGGAVAVLGSSRAAFAGPSRDYNIGFFESLHDSGIVHIGETFVQSRILHTPNAWFDSSDHYTHFLYNFLGDPEMIVHTCVIDTTLASYPDTIQLGPLDISVNVLVDGTPRQGALVCLQKDVEEYEFGYTDASGDVTLSFVAESPGSIDVTVSGHNMTTHLGTITVDTQSDPYVHVESLVIDDDAIGASSGNEDLVLDAGESIEPGVTFVNDGDGVAVGVTGVLRIPSSWATVPDSSYSVGVLSGSGGTANALGQISFAVADSTPDGTVLPLTFVSTNGTLIWSDVVNKVVHAPNVVLTRLEIQDPMPGGNDDGVIQAGETFELWPYFKNYGSGAADGLQATLSSVDPDVTIFQDIVSIGRLEALQEATGVSPFQLSEAVLDENTLQLTLTDRYARTQILSLTLRGPSPPAIPNLDASAGPKLILATWTPSSETDLCGYHVYRSQSDTGPWTRATIDRTSVAYFRDAGLMSNTRYYYYVTAVDSSGNESAPSAIASISTNPPQLAGWPVFMTSPTSCPAVVGDITGDASKEIVAGNDHLYAWGWDGIELRDDDGDPQTWGVFAVEIQTITGAVALGQIDPLSPGFEVVAPSWEDMNRVFVVRGDGSFVTGWPQAPDPSSSPKGYWAAASAVDVDEDGVDEVFVPGKNGNFYAWNADGSPLGVSAAFKTGLGTYSRSSPSFANLDSIPDREIVYGSINGQLYIWHHDGSDFANFPQTVGTLCLSSTAIGDVDQNGVQDVVMITEGGNVNVYDTQTGSQLPGWPQSLSVKSNPVSPSPALADFDSDGFLEIVVANNADPGLFSGIRVFDYQGNVLAGWPKTLGTMSESSPIVADVSGDGVPDILFGNQGGLLYGWDAQGQEIEGFPLSVGDFIRSTPYADDVDDDGDIDLVLASWDQNLYIWDLAVAYVPEAAQWPTLQHDMHRTGFYDYTPPPTDVGPGDLEIARIPNAPFLGQNTPNPFNPTTSISYGIPVREGASRAPVRIDVFDVQGRLVRRLLRGAQPPGTYRALWDGRNDQGQLVRSGLYFYRLQVGTRALTRKMLLLK